MNRMLPMPNADDQELQRRLSAALDGVEPRFSLPRYMTLRPRSVVWRLAPPALAAAALSALVVSAYAGTGSPNPAVWAGTVVNVVAPPPALPTAEPTRPSPTRPPVQQQQQPAPEHHESPQPRESPEPTESPEGTSDSSGSGR